MGIIAATGAVAMWLLTVPLFIYFTFYAPFFHDHPLQGSWLASVIGQSGRGIVLWLTILRADLQKLSLEAKHRSEAIQADEAEALRKKQEAMDWTPTSSPQSYVRLSPNARYDSDPIGSPLMTPVSSTIQ